MSKGCYGAAEFVHTHREPALENGFVQIQNRPRIIDPVTDLSAIRRQSFLQSQAIEIVDPYNLTSTKNCFERIKSRKNETTQVRNKLSGSWSHLLSRIRAISGLSSCEAMQTCGDLREDEQCRTGPASYGCNIED
ncbi:uncharacterized protein LOC134217586 [Armigeres subalbatus]|uniref:uncharacterized protein LOC134217586 n=1 Tax=Armigeres subalbatus TaxID=124917 RepID=UPI002ED09CAC